METVAEMSPLERAARALQEEAGRFDAPVASYVWREAAARWEAANPGAFWGDDPAHAGLDIDLESWKIFARAVLQAIREPSEGMIDGGRGVHDYDDSCEDNAEAFNRRNVGCIWAAMIDAALQE